MTCVFLSITLRYVPIWMTYHFPQHPFAFSINNTEVEVFTGAFFANWLTSEAQLLW
jgi:hypothetical protein